MIKLAKDTTNFSCDLLDHLTIAKRKEQELKDKLDEEFKNKLNANQLKFKSMATGNKLENKKTTLKVQTYIKKNKKNSDKNLIKRVISTSKSMTSDLGRLHLNLIENEIKNKTSKDTVQKDLCSKDDRKRRQSTGEILKTRKLNILAAKHQSDLTKSLNESLFKNNDKKLPTNACTGKFVLNFCFYF